MSSNPQQTTFNITNQPSMLLDQHLQASSPPTAAVASSISSSHTSTAMVPTNESNGALIRHENDQLKERLAKLQTSIDHQDQIINMLKNSAYEISLLENQEIKRLQSELDHSLDERERLRQRYQQLEIDLERLRQEYHQVKHSQHLQQLPDSTSMLLNQSMSSAKSQEQKDVYEKTIELYK